MGSEHEIYLATNFYARVKSLAYKTSITIRSNRIRGYKTLLVIDIEHQLLITPKVSELSSSQFNITRNLHHSSNSKGTTIPVQDYYRPREFQEMEAHRFRDSRHMKVLRLSALRTDRPGNIPNTHFCYRLSRLQDHIAVGRIRSMKN